MKITHFCNSFIAIQSGKTRLLCDPWVGSANYGGWMSYPISQGAKKIFEKYLPTHIYISHLHSDHFCERVLNQLPDKSIPIIIKNFKFKRFYKMVLSAGFKNVVELVEWKALRLSEDLEVTIIPADTTNTEGFEDEVAYDLDTSILIRSLKSKVYFYNGVDNPMSLSQYRAVHAYVKQKDPLAKIDIACIAVGAASEYPQCFLNIDREAEQQKVIHASLKKFKDKLNALEASAYFPAGGHYIIPGKFSILNKYIAQPSLEQLATVVLASIHCKNYYELEGGRSVEYVQNQWIQHESELDHSQSKKEAIQQHKTLKYNYEYSHSESVMSLNELFEKAKTNYFKILKSLSVDTSWKIIFKLYSDLQLLDSAKIKKTKKEAEVYILSQNEYSEPDQTFVCHLDKNLFFDLLTRKCIWNMAFSGSMIMIERTPNFFKPEITFSLNYLAI